MTATFDRAVQAQDPPLTEAVLRQWLVTYRNFMFTAAPSPVTGGTGSPLNPIATF